MRPGAFTAAERARRSPHASRDSRRPFREGPKPGRRGPWPDLTRASSSAVRGLDFSRDRLPLKGEYRMLRPWIASTLVALALSISLIALPGAATAGLLRDDRRRVPARAPGQPPVRRSSPGRTGTSGSRSPTAGRSGASRRPGRSRSSTSPMPTAGPTGSRSAPTATCGSPSASPNLIGKITPSGVITEYYVPTENAQPWDITAMPDGTLLVHRGERRPGRVDRPPGQRDGGPDRRGPAPDAHHHRPGRECLVHGGARQQHRPVRP